MWEERQADLCDFEASPLYSEIQTSQSLNTENLYHKIKKNNYIKLCIINSDKYINDNNFNTVLTV